MRASGLALVPALLLFFGLAPTTAGAVDGPFGGLHGVVADDSGGVLPGVTVTVTAPDGRLLANGVTDNVGRFAFSNLPMAVRVTFQLGGFTDLAVDVDLIPNLDSAIPTQRLKVAPKSETVVVKGEAPPIAPPQPPRIEAPPPAPRAVTQPIPEHDRDSVCGPSKPAAATESFGTIRSRRTAGNQLYAAGDELFINGGRASGLEIGQNVVARRAYRTSADPNGAAGEHTAGLLQIVSTDEDAAVATVIYACDELLPGDWLAPFKPEPVRAPEPPGIPAYDRAARIFLTDAGQLIGAPRRLMVIDRGSDNAFRVGQRLTLFRPRPGGRGPAIVGDAVIVAVQLDSATIRVQQAVDVIALGDFAAPQRP
jgi:hypothetical protein